MSDACLLWNGDLAVSSIGDIALADNAQLSQQRVLRRLLTNPGDYLWQPTYGAGLAEFIGSPCDPAVIRGRIRSQIFMEEAVARSPEPTINVDSAADGSVYVQIQYTDFQSDQTQNLTFFVRA